MIGRIGPSPDHRRKRRCQCATELHTPDRCETCPGQTVHWPRTQRNCIRREAGWRASERSMQTITKVNLIRLTDRSSLLAKERRQACRVRPARLVARPSHGKARPRLQSVAGDRMHDKASESEGGRADGKGRIVSDITRRGRDRVTNAQPNRTSVRPSAVRALIRAKNPGNAGGAKWGRKRNARNHEARKPTKGSVRKD